MLARGECPFEVYDYQFKVETLSEVKAERVQVEADGSCGEMQINLRQSLDVPKLGLAHGLAI